MPYFEFPEKDLNINNLTRKDTKIYLNNMLTRGNGAYTPANNTTAFNFLHHAPKYLANGSTITIWTSVTTGMTGGAVTWAEVGLYTGDIVITPGAYASSSPTAPSLTRNCYASVTGTFNSTGMKGTVLTLTSDIAVGTGLWVGYGCQTTGTRFALLTCGFDRLFLGLLWTSSATRVSTHANPITPGTFPGAAAQGYFFIEC